MNDEDLVRRAEHAKRLLDDPMLSEAFDTIERECIAAWKAAPARDTDGREKLWLTVKAVNRIREELSGIIETGKVSAHNLAEIRRGIFAR